MATLYQTIQRQVMLRGNQLKADSATALATNYSVANIGATELGDRAIDFPKIAIDDAILNAGDRIVTAIGENKDSPYRSHFADQTTVIASGGAIPTVSGTSKPIVGVIGRVFDSATARELEFKPLPMVRSANVLTGLKTSLYYYGTDNVRIWHTVGNVYADVVIWSKEDQLALMASNPTGTCPFPQGLHEALVCGALSYMFRQAFNNETVGQWRNYFDSVVSRLEQGKMIDETV